MDLTILKLNLKLNYKNKNIYLFINGEISIYRKSSMISVPNLIDTMQFYRKIIVKDSQ